MRPCSAQMERSPIEGKWFHEVEPMGSNHTNRTGRREQTRPNPRLPGGLPMPKEKMREARQVRECREHHALKGTLPYCQRKAVRWSKPSCPLLFKSEVDDEQTCLYGILAVVPFYCVYASDSVTLKNGRRYNLNLAEVHERWIKFTDGMTATVSSLSSIRKTTKKWLI